MTTRQHAVMTLLAGLFGLAGWYVYLQVDAMGSIDGGGMGPVVGAFVAAVLLLPVLALALTLPARLRRERRNDGDELA